MPIRRLVDARPEVPADRLVAELVPPPRFESVRFDTYLPDPDHPTQAAAVRALAKFGAEIPSPSPTRGRSGGRGGLSGLGGLGGLGRLGGRLGRSRAKQAPSGPAGVYLDGGFGVGKTHLLASLWHVAPPPKAFGTFVEFTNLVGALGFAATVDALRAYSLVCIDEFELDDPGDTVLMSTLLNRLVEAGVRLGATSNTLPGALGEGRFAAEDFLREIQGLAAHFRVVRVDGEDYRHRGLPAAPPPYRDEEVRRRAEEAGERGDPVTLDDFPGLLAHLATLHPSRYGALLDGVAAVHLLGVGQVPDQSVALRLVVLADRLYDRDIPVVASGRPFDEMFGEDMLRGGYRKKYFRAISRLVALAREGEGLDEPELRH